MGLKIENYRLRFEAGFMVAVSSLSFGFGLRAFAQEQTRVSIVDGGSDFSHPAFANSTFTNAAEVSGTNGTDDDKNGYIDDISGWDLVGNNSRYFTDDAKSFFGDHADKITKGFALNDRIEMGDPKAEAALAADSVLESITFDALDYAHGTHVAGLVNETSLKSALLDSANVVTGSDGESDLAKRRAFKKDPAASFYSDRAAIDALLESDRRETLEWVESLNQYLKVFAPRIVNLSLGVSYTDLVEQENEYWLDETRARKLSRAPRLSDFESKNRAYLIAGLLNTNEASFEKMIASNPQILFVAAAGNSGINSDIEENFPPNLSAKYPNLMAIAATDDSGRMADFSSYSKTFVDLAAPGVAKRSTAPSGRFVKMSGTSMAAPFVSGVASRVLQINQALAPAELRDLLNQSTQPYEDLIGMVKSAGVLVPARAFALAQKSLALPSFLANSLFQQFGSPTMNLFRYERANQRWDKIVKAQRPRIRPRPRVARLKFPTQLKANAAGVAAKP